MRGKIAKRLRREVGYKGQCEYLDTMGEDNKKLLKRVCTGKRKEYQQAKKDYKEGRRS